MKKFGRKLFLSGLALAATAATLSTSTYAWYVTNSNADVTGGTAATAGTEVGGNLLVAQNVTKTGAANPGKGAYSNRITLDGTFNSVNLDTVTKDAASSTGWYDRDKTAVATTAAYQEISFWVLSTSATKVYIDTTVENTTALKDYVKQTALNTSNTPDDAVLNTPFFVDAAYALRFEVLKQELTKLESEDAASLKDATSLGVYSIEKFATTYTNANKDSALTGGNANLYYHDIMNSYPQAGFYAASADAETGALVENLSENKFTSIDVSKGVETLITIRIWLEGRDSDCFDSCRGQKFSYSFALTSTAPSQS